MRDRARAGRDSLAGRCALLARMTLSERTTKWTLHYCTQKCANKAGVGADGHSDNHHRSFSHTL